MANWTPNNAASFTAQQYYDYWDPATLTQSGGFCTQANDRTANARHATASGGNRPAYSATGFNGGPGLSGGSGIRMTATSAKPGLVLARTLGDTATLDFTPYGSTDDPGATTTGLDLTQPTIVLYYWDTSGWVSRINGTPAASGGFTDAPDEPGIAWAAVQLIDGGPFGNGRWCASSGTTLYLFNNASANRETNGALGAQGFGTAAAIPAQADAERVEGYIAWNTGLQGLLPAGHPYEFGPPTTNINAAASITEGADGLSAAALLKLRAAAGIAEAGDTLGGAALLRIQAAASLQEAGDTLSATGAATSGVTASAAMTEAGDAVSSAGVLKLQALASIIEAGDALTSTALLKIKAGFAVAEAADTLVADGRGPLAALAGALAVAEAGDGLISAGRVFGWLPIPPTDETWSPIPVNDETWTPIAWTAVNWS